MKRLLGLSAIQTFIENGNISHLESNGGAIVIFNDILRRAQISDYSETVNFAEALETLIKKVVRSNLPSGGCI